MSNFNNTIGGDFIPVDVVSSKRSIKTRTRCALVSADFSQQE